MCRKPLFFLASLAECRPDFTERMTHVVARSLSRVVRPTAFPECGLERPNLLIQALNLLPVSRGLSGFPPGLRPLQRALILTLRPRVALWLDEFRERASPFSGVMATSRSNAEIGSFGCLSR